MSGTTITTSTETGLNNAIGTADTAVSGNFTIDLTGNLTETIDLSGGGPIDLTLNAGGAYSSDGFTPSSGDNDGNDIIVGTLAAPGLVYGQTLDQAGIVATTETVAAGVMTLFNSGAAAVGTVSVGISLSTGDFLLTSDGSGGTDVIVDTVFGTYSSDVTLLVDPTAIASTARITGSTEDATGVYGPSATAWTLTNQGTINETGANSYGVSFASAGTITNAASAIVAGYRTGIVASTDPVTVVNSGSIGGSLTGGGIGVHLRAGGSVTNQSGGTITGTPAGIYITGGAGTVSNAGLIIGVNSSNGTGFAVQLSTGSVTNLSGGVITGDGIGVQIQNSGGYVTNASGGSITGGSGVAVYGELFTLVNAGDVSGTGTSFTSSGVYLAAGGSVTNQSGGTIGGESYGIIVYNGAGTVTNAGTIVGTHYRGVWLSAGGAVTNQSGGTIIGDTSGVYTFNGTVTNAGTIESSQGTAGDAVYFSGALSQLIVDPGAVFVGSIYGGNLDTSVMELASAASAGTISGFGASITNFGSLVFDAGAQWTVAGNDSANGLGTLAISGFAAGDTIDLTNFAATNKNFASNALVLGNGVGDHETLHISGTFVSAEFHIGTDGSGGTDITFTPLPPPVIAGTAAGQTTTDEATDQPFSAATITDANGSQSETVTITVTSADVATDADGTLSGTGLNKTGTGTYELSASNAAAITTALQALVFTPTAHQVAPGDTVTTGFTIQDTDLYGLSATDSATTVIATAVNDPPVIANAMAGQSTTDEAAIDPFSAVLISDVDHGQTETVTVTLSTAANGTLSDLDGGSYNSGTGVYSDSGTDAEVTTALQALVFTPTAHQVVPGDTITTTFTIRATDSAGGNSSDSTTTVVATAVNDPATITLSGATVGVPNEANDTPFAAMTINDPDVGHTDTVTVTLSDPTGGVLADTANVANATVYFNDLSLPVTGSDGPASDEVTVGGDSFTAATPDFKSISLLLSAANPSDGGSVLVYLSPDDGSGGSTGVAGIPTFATTLAGSELLATIPDSSLSTTAALTTINVSLSAFSTLNQEYWVMLEGSGSSTFQWYYESSTSGGVDLMDQSSTYQDGGYTTEGDYETDGAYSMEVFTPDLDGGSFDATTGVYSVSGTASAVTTALDGLTFTPAAPASGYLRTTSFTVSVAGSGGDAGNDAISVTAVDQVLGLATTSGGNDAISVRPDGVGFPAATDGKTNQAVVTDPSSGTTYTLPSGYQAEFLGGTAGATLTDPSVGGALLVGNSGDDLITAAAAGDTILGGGGGDTLSGAGIGDVILGGNGNNSIGATGTGSITGGTGTNTFLIMSSGGESVISNGVNDLVNLVTGAVSVSATSVSSGTKILSGFATVFASITGSNATLEGGTGHVDVTTGGSKAFVIGDTGALTARDPGSHDTIFAGAASSATISASGKDGLLLGGTGTLAASLGGGTETSNTLVGGSGLNTLTAGGTDDLIAAGAGSTTVNSNGTSNTILGGGGSLAVNDSGTDDGNIIAAFGALAPSVTLGGSGALAWGGSNAFTVVATNLEDTVIGGAAATTVSIDGGLGENSSNVVLGGSGGLAVDDIDGQADTIAAFGASSAGATLGGSKNIVFGGSGGALTASMGGSHNIVAGAGGSYATSVTVAAGATDAEVLGGAGVLTVDDLGTGDVIGAFGAASASATLGGANGIMFGGGGSVTASLGGSGNIVVGGSVSASVTVAAAATDAEVVGGTGILTVDDLGTGDVIGAFGATSANVTLGGANAVLFGGSGSVTARVSGSGNLLVGGSASNAVTVTGASDTILAGSGAMTVAGSSSTGLVVAASAGNLDFVGGSSGTTILGSAGAMSINGGAGGETLFGAAGLDVEYLGATGGLLFVAGSGSETLDAGGASSNNEMVGGAGSDTIIGGTGNDTMVGGSGSASLVGSTGSSADWFIFMQVNAGSADTIANFTDTDTAWLAGYGSGAAATAVAGATTVAGGTVISLAGGTTITFADLTVAQLQTDFAQGRIFSTAAPT